MDPIEPSNDPPPGEEISVPSPAAAGSSNRPRNASLPLRSRRPSIRVLRVPSPQPVMVQLNPQHGDSRGPQHNEEQITNRRRSSSEPQRPQHLLDGENVNIYRAATRDMPMSPVAEEPSHGSNTPSGGQYLRPNMGRLRRASATAMSSLGLKRVSTVNGPEVGAIADRQANEYETELVNLLDVVDPEISTLTTLTNVQNSLFVPDLGPFFNRRPTYTLTRPEESSEEDTQSSDEEQKVSDTSRPELPRMRSSRLEGPCFAVLPDGVELTDWSESDLRELNDHVRHMLHSRRSKFKRSMKGFGQYVRKPLGFLVTLYATLITLFGLAWVLFLIGWINVGGRQLYIINVIDNVLVALFAIVGDGLAPFRAIDTYHMIFIAHYHHLTWRLRREKALPKLHNKNDLPRLSQDVIRKEKDADIDIEKSAADTASNIDDANDEFSVLTPAQQKKLEHHQKKFSKSHTFYKPHETTTHYAFPLRLLVAVVVLLDFHSLFQIALGACTWGIYYKVRPFALTTVILCCSITCNITAGVLIWYGDRKSRKNDVVERMFRQELTKEAMKKVDKKRKKEERRHRERDEVELIGKDVEGVMQVKDV
ncbi:hypothetical protein FQN52_005081 [Onygenales sp. PD_12]|nr:hypothetical protein FQN52_005081 [Onygenales sp. PD_12]